MATTVKIGEFLVGPGQGCFLIAEVGTTCLGDMEKALKLAQIAKDAGMDAVKYQIIDPYQDTQRDASYRVVSNTGVEQMVNMREMFAKLAFTREEWARIAAATRAIGIEFLATCDYIAGIDMLEEIGIAAHKIGAWDTTYEPLIEHIGRTGKPMIVDLGPTTQAELDDLVGWYKAAGGSAVLALHDYHTGVPGEMNMHAITHLKATMGAPVGFSSPNRDSDVDFLAIALGSEMLEKRLILSRDEQAFHAHESLEPAELKDWVRRVRNAEKAMGKEAIVPSDADLAGARKYYRSIAVVKPVAAGEVLRKEHLDGKRPGTGLPTSRIGEFIGRKAACDMAADRLLSEADVE